MSRKDLYRVWCCSFETSLYLGWWPLCHCCDLIWYSNALFCWSNFRLYAKHLTIRSWAKLNWPRPPLPIPSVAHSDWWSLKTCSLGQLGSLAVDFTLPWALLSHYCYSMWNRVMFSLKLMTQLSKLRMPIFCACVWMNQRSQAKLDGHRTRILSTSGAYYHHFHPF